MENIKGPVKKRRPLSPAVFWPLFAVLFLGASGVVLGIASLIKVPEAKSMLMVFASASKRFHETYGKWPENLTDFTQNPQRITFIYSKALLSSDSWGHPWIYQRYDPALGFGLIRSLGRDGKPGGTGLDQDLELRIQ